MFVSAGIELKFHNWPGEDVKSNDFDQYTPSTCSRIQQVSWCNDNNYIVLLSQKGNPEIISTRNKHNVKLVHTVQSLDNITAVTFQRTTKRCLSLGTSEGQVALYDTRNRTITKLFTNLNFGVVDLDFSYDDALMAASAENGTVNVFAISSGDIVETFRMPNLATPTAMRFHPELPKYLAAASANGNVVIWDVSTSTKLFYAQSHTSKVNSIALSSPRETLFSVGQDRKLCVYDLNICECMFRSNLRQPLTSVDVHSNGNHLVVGSDDGHVYLYDMRKLLQPLFTIKPHDAPVNKVVFTNAVDQGNSNETASKTSILNGSMSSVETVEMKVLDSVKAEENLEMKKYCDSLNFQKMKEEVLQALHNHMDDLSKKMTDHFNKFKVFMNNEFLAIDGAMENKCDLMKVTDVDIVDLNCNNPENNKQS